MPQGITVMCGICKERLRGELKLEFNKESDQWQLDTSDMFCSGTFEQAMSAADGGASQSELDGLYEDHFISWVIIVGSLEPDRVQAKRP